MSRLKSLAKDTVVFGIGMGLSKLVLFFMLPMFTFAMSADSYGIAELIVSVTQIVLPIATLGIAESVFRYAIDDEYTRINIYRFGFMVVSAGAVLLTLICVIASFCTSYEYLFDFLILYVALSFAQLMKYYLRGLGHVKLFAISGVCNALTVAALGFVLVLQLGFDVHGYLLAFAAGYLVEVLVIAVVDREYVLCIGSFDKELSKEALRYALPLVPNTISWWFAGISSRYFLTFFCGVGAAGLFSAASKITSVVGTLTDLFGKAWQYSASKEYESSDKAEYYKVTFDIYELVLTLFTSVIILIMKPASTLLLLGEFGDGWIYVDLLLLVPLFNGYSSFFGAFYSAAKNNKMVMVSTMVGAGLCIVCNLVLLPTIGPLGSVIANCLASFSIALIRIVDSRRFADAGLHWRKTGPLFIIIAIQGIVSILTDGNLIINALFVAAVVALNAKTALHLLTMVKRSMGK